MTGTANMSFLQIFFLVCAILVAGLSLPAVFRKTGEMFIVIAGKVFLIVILPLFAFAVSAFLFTPNWKGEARFGWLDTFHDGKVALLPVALWATAALYALEVLKVRDRTRPWLVLGLFQGACLAVFCFFHGVITISFGHSGFHLGWIRQVGLSIPFYVVLWYYIRATEAMRAADLSPRKYIQSLLASAPFWVLSVFLSMKHYATLSARPPDCFVVTAASKGHQRLVGPFVTVAHNGRVRHASTQLRTLWQFEDLWSRVHPRSHACFRAIYNILGYQAARLVRSRWSADVAYLCVKPFELVARCALLLETRPPERSPRH
jgi:hypothetical protein